MTVARRLARHQTPTTMTTVPCQDANGKKRAHEVAIAALQEEGLCSRALVAILGFFSFLDSELDGAYRCFSFFF